MPGKVGSDDQYNINTPSENSHNNLKSSVLTAQTVERTTPMSTTVDSPWSELRIGGSPFVGSSEFEEASSNFIVWRRID